MSNYLPVIGITMGDATGVGPEIIVKSLTHDTVYKQCRPLVVGDARRLERANEIVGGSAKVRRIESASEAKYEPGTIVAEGDYVIVHGRFSNTGRPRNWIAADVVRVADDVLAEHWDVLQDEATEAESQSGLPMFGTKFFG